MKKLIYFLPSIIWMCFIFYLSSQSTIGIGQTKTERFLILKTFHLIEYATLAIFLLFAFRRYLPSALFAYLYALTDELHQRFVPGREGKFQDTLIDLLGITLGLIFIKYFLIKLYSKLPNKFKSL
ncbi:MAG TPA: VanZ family protein [Candidatus Woesebacteria bacterium]|nr:VanZ family protein [Candidatus Woesebacteria bacterium]HPJ16882.1 VanZ family protein [Candidatus Woesebacteria bacterium]